MVARTLVYMSVESDTDLHFMMAQGIIINQSLSFFSQTQTKIK